MIHLTTVIRVGLGVCTLGLFTGCHTTDSQQSSNTPGMTYRQGDDASRQRSVYAPSGISSYEKGEIRGHLDEHNERASDYKGGTAYYANEQAPVARRMADR